MPLDFSQRDYVWAAVNDRNLLISHNLFKPPITETLEIVEFASFREIMKVPYATQPRESGRRIGTHELSSDMGLGVSDDKKILVYSFDHVLLCRRMNVFKILWTRQLESKLFGFAVVVSASGSHFAAVLTDFKNEHNITVYDGKTGTELPRLPINE
jgi:hypothetical protein